MSQSCPAPPTECRPPSAPRPVAAHTRRRPQRRRCAPRCRPRRHRAPREAPRGCFRVVEKEGRRREVRNLQRAEDRPLASRIENPGSDDRATAAARSARTRLRLVRERHAVPLLEDAPARERAVGVVRPNRSFARVLAQPDHHQPPAKLLAEAPLEHAERGIRRVRPRAAGVGVEGRFDHGRSRW